jgi:hypothetical protein
MREDVYVHVLAIDRAPRDERLVMPVLAAIDVKPQAGLA